jgi:hypothetical protein
MSVPLKGRTKARPYNCRTSLVIGFLRVIFVPLRNFDDDVGGAVGNRLAAEARLRGDAGSFVKLVQLGVSGFVAGLQAFVNNDVTGGASADAAAGMVEAYLEAFGNIQDATGNAVVAVGNLRWVHFNGFAAGKKRHFVLLRGRSVFDFVDVWIAAAHDF